VKDLDLLEEQKRELRKNSLIKIKSFLYSFALVLLVLLIPFYFLYFKFKYYSFSFFVLIFSYFVFFFCKEFCNLKKKQMLLILPLLGNIVFLLDLLLFNYFYWMELIFILAVLLFVYYYSSFNFYRKYFKYGFLLVTSFALLVFFINLIPSYFLFKKDGYYSFVYLPWNSVKLEVTYTWQQPVVGVKWVDKVLENGEIIKVSEPYVKDYILHEIKETVWYNFFTRNYLVKVEGLKNESNWLVVTPYYQNNRSVANNVECFFEIGEAQPHEPVTFYEKNILKFMGTKDKIYFSKLYQFTTFRSEDEKFTINDWYFYKPAEVVYLFKRYFVPMGSEFLNNKNLCEEIKKEKSIEKSIFKSKKDKKEVKEDEQ